MRESSCNGGIGLGYPFYMNYLSYGGWHLQIECFVMDFLCFREWRIFVLLWLGSDISRMVFSLMMNLNGISLFPRKS